MSTPNPYEEIIHLAEEAEQPPEATTAEAPTEQPPASEEAPTTYTAVYGDTPRSIAEAHGLSVDELMALNAGDLVDPDSLYVGATYRLA